MSAVGVYVPASHTTSLSSFVPASPARSHHGFSDSQRGVSDEPESSPGHDLLPALPSAHLLLPVSLPASVKPLSRGGAVAFSLPPALRLAKLPLAISRIVVEHTEELFGVLSSGELGQVVGPPFSGSKRVLVSGSGGKGTRMPGSREVGRVSSLVSFTPSDVILNPLFPTDVWLLRSGSHFPKHFSIHPGLELGFYITGSGCLPRILPAARLTLCPGSQLLLSHRSASLTWAHLPRMLWLGFSTPNTSRLLLPHSPESPYLALLLPSCPALSLQS